MTDQPATPNEPAASNATDPTSSKEWLRETYGPCFRGERYPQTPEELMGSRYAAYALGEIDWVISTHWPDTRNEVDRSNTEQWSKQSEWLGFEITKSEPVNDEHSFVEFVARYKLKGALLTHRERAEFKKLNGRWYFVDGEQIAGPPVRVEKLPGRNDPCPCGSGKKYKKCHGKPG